MDSSSVIIVAVAIAVSAGVLVLLAGLRAEQKRARETAEKLAQELTRAQAGLAGRFQQLSDSHIASRTQLTRSIENTEKAGKTMSEIQQRLAVIDRAQKSLAELSEQVVGLQDILSNK
ncbi:MAG TPA: DNA recombination protein RmuC, partial [Alphaproteobacteria bacterium]|nr:DNA recombination protein RmuC [Alphaproteobacteria bacterium]